MPSVAGGGYVESPRTPVVGHCAARPRLEIRCPTSRRASPRVPPERSPTPSCFASPSPTSAVRTPTLRPRSPGGSGPSWCASPAPTPSRRRPGPADLRRPQLPARARDGRTGWESIADAARGARPGSVLIRGSAPRGVRPGDRASRVTGPRAHVVGPRAHVAAARVGPGGTLPVTGIGPCRDMTLGRYRSGERGRTVPPSNGPPTFGPHGAARRSSGGMPGGGGAPNLSPQAVRSRFGGHAPRAERDRGIPGTTRHPRVPAGAASGRQWAHDRCQPHGPRWPPSRRDPPTARRRRAPPGRRAARPGRRCGRGPATRDRARGHRGARHVRPRGGLCAVRARRSQRAHGGARRSVAGHPLRRVTALRQRPRHRPLTVRDEPGRRRAWSRPRGPRAR